MTMTSFTFHFSICTPSTPNCLLVVQLFCFLPMFVVTGSRPFVTDAMPWAGMRPVLCNADEFYDTVVSRCALCRDVCSPLYDVTFCLNNCPGYYRHHIQPLVTAQPPSRRHMTFTPAAPYPNNRISTSGLAPRSDQQQRLTSKPLFWTSVASMFVAVIATIIIVVLCFCRRQKPTARGRSVGAMARSRHLADNLLKATVEAQIFGGKDDDSHHSDVGPHSAISLRSTSSGGEALRGYSAVAGKPGGKAAGKHSSTASTTPGNNHVTQPNQPPQTACSNNSIYHVMMTSRRPSDVLPVDDGWPSDMLTPRVPSVTSSGKPQKQCSTPMSQQNTVGGYINQLAAQLEAGIHQQQSYASTGLPGKMVFPSPPRYTAAPDLTPFPADTDWNHPAGAAAAAETTVKRVLDADDDDFTRRGGYIRRESYMENLPVASVHNLPGVRSRHYLLATTAPPSNESKYFSNKVASGEACPDAGSICRTETGYCTTFIND